MHAAFFSLSALCLVARSVLWGMFNFITLETADRDNLFARYSSIFRQLISQKGLPMCFPSLRAHAKSALLLKRSPQIHILIVFERLITFLHLYTTVLALLLLLT